MTDPPPPTPVHPELAADDARPDGARRLPAASADDVLANGARRMPAPPERLVIPPGAVADLLQIALRSQEGNAWWRGFVTAHGEPPWIAKGEWRWGTAPAEIVRAALPQSPPPPRGRG
jgi:hypothetical protein